MVFNFEFCDVVYVLRLGIFFVWNGKICLEEDIDIDSIFIKNKLEYICFRF